MIPLLVVSLAAIGALAYLQIKANKQIDALLDRIQAPEVVVQRMVKGESPKIKPITPDMGPWSQPPEKEES